MASATVASTAGADRRVGDGAAVLSSRSINAEASQRLLKHANEVRKHANLDTLDAYLEQSGHTWIEIMISHARDSRESYIQSRMNDGEDSAAMSQAFEHRMTAELLKTPSPKKKSTAANIARFPIAGPSHAGLQHAKAALRIESEDKENRPVLLSDASPSRPKATTKVRKVDQAERSRQDARSKVAKDADIRPPQSSDLRKAEEKKIEPTKGDPTSLENGNLSTKMRKKNGMSRKVEEVTDRSAVKPVDGPEDTVQTVNLGKSDEAAFDQADRRSAASEMTQRHSHEKSGEATKQSTSSRTDEVTLPWGPAPPSPESFLATAPASPEKEERPQKSSTASSVFVTASTLHEHVENAEDRKHEDAAELQATAKTAHTQATEDELGTPRESTPPPKSPSKQRLAEVAEAATQKLEASLLRLDEDDQAVEEHLSILDECDPAQQTLRANSDPEAQTVSDEEDDASEIGMEKAETTAPNDAQTSASAASEVVQVAQEIAESVLEAQAIASAPKRTLSSITHAKKSIIPATDPKQPLVASSGTRPSTSKGSFLSKSLAQVDADVRQLPSSEEHGEASKPSSTTAPTTEASKKRKSAVEVDVSARTDFISLPEHKKAKGHRDDGDIVRLQSAVPAAEVEKSEGKSLAPTNKEAFSDHSKVPAKADSSKRVSTQPQTFREKIESFQTSKVTNATHANTQASRNVGSMSTHSVGIGAKKLSSPIFSRSNSQTQFAQSSEPDEVAEGTARAGLAALFKEREIVRADPEEKSGIPRAVGGSTTPLQSPTRSLNAAIKQTPTRIPAPSKAAKLSPQRATPLRPANDDTLSDSDEDVFDGTSSDGDLSLVELRQADQLTLTGTRAPSTAPRPPGSQMRSSNAVTKNVTQDLGSKAVFMPSSSTSRDATTTIRSAEPLPASTKSSVPHQQVQPQPQAAQPTTPHGTWGGSISLKLKGILGFATPGGSTANGSKAQNRAPGPSSIVRKESSGTGNNVAAKLASISSARTNAGKHGASDKMGSSSHVARKASERDLAAKASLDLKKRMPEEQVEASTLAKSKVPTYTQANAARQMLPKAPSTTTKMPEAPDAKRRKTNEVPTSSNKYGAAGPSAQSKTQAPLVKTSSQIAQKSAGPSMPTTKAPQVLKPQPSRPPPGQNVFSDQNPFQKAQAVQQDRALAAVSKQLQQTKPQQQPNYGTSSSKATAASTKHIELEEPDSAYSDSDDEETIRRRMQHKPWETRDGLALALEAQSTVDADMIFGIPQGAVPLDEILPAQTEGARSRRMRPRSSSATWSRDGLKQVEIDRYNERMGIQGPGVKLPTAGELANSQASRLPGATSNASPARSSGNHRLSAIAQSAVAQGHVSKKAERTSTQYSHFR